MVCVDTPAGMLSLLYMADMLYVIYHIHHIYACCMAAMVCVSTAAGMLSDIVV